MVRPADGWLPGARRVPSPNRDARPAGAEPNLIVVHAISLPRGHYRKDGRDDAIARLFTNRLDPTADPSFADLAGLKVSSHFVIYRDGGLAQFVPVGERAWHAGASRWRGRERCNDHSVGIELEGVDDAPFERAQYRVLVRLLRELSARWPLRSIAAHSDVAPGRKTDPGAGFDWRALMRALAARGARTVY